ncbi:hypothetical protein Tsubulata_042160 [Turnera subulata]|uniref:FBD domain-containing protein n=1 Tax=Turnera subulata TaxID=218843 RepID=A0A9Q0F3K3_9ROSI|nr:hypothetical protein Tsubulata_042160 [Turnera subulata]
MHFNYCCPIPDQRWFEFVETTLFYHDRYNLRKLSVNLEYHYFKDPCLRDILTSFPNWNYVGRWLRHYQRTHMMLRPLLQDIRHVKQVSLGSWCIEILSAMEDQGVPAPFSERTGLTLLLRAHRDWNEDMRGLANLLRSSPYLEKLIINLDYAHIIGKEPCLIEDPTLEEGSYWASQATDFECLMMHLKVVEINGVIPCNINKGLLGFVQFLIRHARVLESMTANVGGVKHHIWKCSESR